MKYAAWEVAAAILYYQYNDVNNCAQTHKDCVGYLNDMVKEIRACNLSRLGEEGGTPARTLDATIRKNDTFQYKTGPRGKGLCFWLDDRFNIDDSDHYDINEAYKAYRLYKKKQMASRRTRTIKSEHWRPGITQITLKNFKGIKNEVKIPLRPITMLFGGNSAGKSTVLHSLLYFRELLATHNCNPGKVMNGTIDLGDARNLVYGHAWDGEITLRLDCNLDDDGFKPFFPEETNNYRQGIPDFNAGGIEDFWIEISIAFDLYSHKGYLKSYEVGLNGLAWAKILRNDGGEICLSELNLNHDIISDEENILTQYFHELISEENLFPYYKLCIGQSMAPDDERICKARLLKLAQNDVIPVLHEPISLYSDNVVRTFEKFSCFLSQSIVRPAEILLEYLNKMLYIGPLREIPDRKYYCPPTSDPARWVTGLAAWDAFTRDEQSELQKEAQTWFDYLKLGYTISSSIVRPLDLDNKLWKRLDELAEDGTITSDDVQELQNEYEMILSERRLRIVDRARDTEVQLQDIGVGISQSVPIVMGALHPGSIYAFEQPELHLHPAIQCRMGDLFIDQVNRFRHKIFLLETHSEHLILRLLRRIRETSTQELPPDATNYHFSSGQIGVLYFESTADGTKVTELPVSSDGDFENSWPHGFFEERAEELF